MGDLPRNGKQNADRRPRPLHAPRMVATILQCDGSRDRAGQSAAQGVGVALPRRHDRRGRGHWPANRDDGPPHEPRRGRARGRPDLGEGRDGFRAAEAVGSGRRR